ncbi:MAG: excinuclease ABC subunit UvrA, partial [Bdellovibrionales bacterium]|nr:excinuclease ABC subunit UvrA [Bdellovibrionales bacterium]
SGVRQNNLKNITVEFPARKISVVTGLSGSGKSSLAFDTLYAEGQRRYIESLSTYTRQFLDKMPKPDLDSIENIPPSIALEQKNQVLNSRSTVGSQTEVLDHLRVLYAKVGETSCLDCGGEVRKLEPQALLEWAEKWAPGRKCAIAAPLQPAPSTAEPARVKQKKTQKPKKGAKKKSVSLQTASLQSHFEILREQGYRRLLYRSPKDQAIGLDLEELGLPEFPQIPDTALQEGRLFIIIDRLKIAKHAPNESLDTETRTRLSDSIRQALSVGRQRILWIEYASDSDSAALWKIQDLRFSCVQCGREHQEAEPNLFSFNSPMGACARCSGFGYTLELDENLIVPDPSKTLKNGAIDPFSKPSFQDWQKDLFRFCERNGISVGKRYRELTSKQRELIWKGSPDDKIFPGILACFEELKRWKYKLHVRVFIRRYQAQLLCPDCQGARLRAEARAVTVAGKSLPELLLLPIDETLDWLTSLGKTLPTKERKIASEIFQQVQRRLEFLVEVGVGYLTLSRLTRTLSGGEYQRICLATQLGNGLCGTLYVLDEPSIGLHAADTHRLIRILKRLRDQGNTVVVVEHDLEVMKNADWLVELGPGAGSRGGELVCQGTASQLGKSTDSVTGKYISGTSRVEPVRSLRPARAKRGIKITECSENNLKSINVDFPLDRFVVVTGVSGSGKSTLVHKTLHHALARIIHRQTDLDVGRFKNIYGAEQISGVVLLDQSPIGKSSRSNPATYLKAWDEVRRVYASQALALRRGYTPQHFSFNVDGGRCPVCKGEGEIAIDMHFMAEVRIPCEECNGKRFKKSILDVTYRGKDIFQLLQTTIDQAYELFQDNPTMRRKLGILREVGLGYLQVGQSSTTLSGGESQRLKIAATLDDRTSENLLYIFDEPSTGLHLDDVKKLLRVVQDLVDAGHSVVMIEHHLDMIAQADWIIDLGPGGGAAGGGLIAQGPPDQLINNPESITGKMLQEAGYQFPARELVRSLQ